MIRIEYVYEKPIEKKSHKKIGVVIVLIILIAVGLLIYSNFNLLGFLESLLNNNVNNTSENIDNLTEEQNNVLSAQDYENIVIPPEYTGQEGLDFVKANYAPTVDRARSLCTEQFSGEWIDSPIEMGCYNMQGFIILYCSAETVQDLRNICSSINGNSTCTPNMISCTV